MILTRAGRYGRGKGKTAQWWRRQRLSSEAVPDVRVTSTRKDVVSGAGWRVAASLGESTPSSRRHGAHSGDDGALRLSSPDPSGSYGVLGMHAWRLPWLSRGCERVDAVVADREGGSEGGNETSRGESKEVWRVVYEDWQYRRRGQASARWKGKGEKRVNHIVGTYRQHINARVNEH
ncbi:hypothetical protein PLICRDRAFT_429682 [Plicaturopsis crispa FD-325 SS-3]|nr:hypothetical protein PLICRDRAFT_429682 [Plicaturopsis crispa FD-325 SS-3]